MNKSMAGWLMAVLLLGGCHVIFPFTNAPLDGDTFPDAALDISGVDAPADLTPGDSKQLDTWPQPDLAKPDLAKPDAPPDGPPADALLPDAHPDAVPDTVADTVPSLCYSFPKFYQDFGNTTWKVDNIISGTIKRVGTTFQFSSGAEGTVIQHDPLGLFCAPSKMKLKIEFKHTCTDGQIGLLFYTDHCTTAQNCGTALFNCTSLCKYGSSTEICTTSIWNVAEKPIRSIVLNRKGGSLAATAVDLTITASP
jgi:hypothetical protein